MLALYAAAIIAPLIGYRLLSRAGRPSAPRGFRIVREIGQGGMGVVYEALDETLQRRVAIKRLRDEIAGDRAQRRRLLEEARTVAALKHPNIVEIHSVIEHRKGLYLIFEYVEGPTLWELTAKGPWSPDKALPVLRQIAAALDYAHARGVIHRDLKPSNIMLAEGGVVKIMDFGIARRVEDLAVASAEESRGGTPAYMAPEQERGVAFRESDLYSLGVCLYEMLAGYNPFNGAGEVSKAPPRPLSEAAPGVPRAVDRVLAAALSVEPHARQPTAGLLVAELEHALG